MGSDQETRQLVMSNSVSSSEQNLPPQGELGRCPQNLERQHKAVVLGSDFELGQLLFELWRSRALFLGVVLAFFMPAIVYAFTATEWYRAEVVLIPAEDSGQLGGLAELGGLASIAGVNVARRNSDEPLAVLQSRSFLREFIESENLLPVLFAKRWNAERSGWGVDDGTAPPDWRDGVKFMNEKVVSIAENRKTGLVTLAIEWTDPDTAARWANLLVAKLNAKIKSVTIESAKSRIDYLTVQMTNTQVIPLQQAMAELLEAELRRLTIAQGDEEFAFRTIDVATPPKHRDKPARFMIAIGSLLTGVFFGVLTVLILRRDVLISH